MNTKIVYVIVSSGDNDIYLEQAWLSIHSLKRINSKAYVVVVMDKLTKLSLKGKRTGIKSLINEIVVADTPEGMTAMERSRYIKTSVRKLITGNFLFIDCDTIITEKINDIDSISDDIAAVPDFHVPFVEFPNYQDKVKQMKSIYGIDVKQEQYYFNSGVIFVRDSPMSHHLYESWHKNWMEQRKYHYYFDQTALLKANIDCGHPIKQLAGEWNCQIITSIQYLNKAKILHFYGKPWFPSSCFSPFLGKEIYLDIKSNGSVSNELDTQIKNIKNLFKSPSVVVGLEEFRFLRSNYGRKLQSTFEKKGLLFYLIKIFTYIV